MEKVTLDPEGDVCFVAGLPDASTESPAKIGFIVSSKALKLASGVFVGLLSPNFREGAALQQQQQSSPLEIPLPDDDPTGLRILLQVIPHQTPPERLELSELAAVALLVDKYQCQHLFRVYSTAWITGLIHGRGADPDLLEYLGICLAFKNEELFRPVSLGVALTTGLPQNQLTVSERISQTMLADLVPNDVSST